MKSDKLQDAIGMVDEQLISRAVLTQETEKRTDEDPAIKHAVLTQKNQKSKHRLRWLAPIAAALAVIVAATAVFGNTPNMSTAAHAVCEAVYPQMASYPGSEIIPGFESRYDEWNEARRAQRAYFGAGENLNGFFKKTAGEFLFSDETQNRIYSPINVFMALAMLAEITDTQTRAQILDLLSASDIDTLRAQAHAVWNANYCDDGALTSILANSVWLNEDVEFKKGALDTLAQSYYASTYRGKMGSKDFTKTYKDWLNNQTEGLLTDYVDAIELDPELLMTLASTVLFRGKWENEFKEANTKAETFHAPDGDVICDFMHQTETYGDVYWGEQFLATKKHLKNSGGDMWFILPDENVSVNELFTNDETLSFMFSNGEWDNAKSLRVNLAIPKFDVSSQLNLADGLRNLGVTNCFDSEKADFSPLVVNGQTAFISQVNHGARVAIDEEGVTATAYVEMHLAGAAMPPEDEVDFVLDRPFVFVITSSDGMPMFVGVVNTP